jgi:hypothetical protein
VRKREGNEQHVRARQSLAGIQSKGAKSKTSEHCQLLFHVIFKNCSILPYMQINFRITIEIKLEVLASNGKVMCGMYCSEKNINSGQL